MLKTIPDARELAFIAASLPDWGHAQCHASERGVGYKLLVFNKAAAASHCHWVKLGDVAQRQNPVWLDVAKS
jgi:hypothetical protein